MHVLSNLDKRLVRHIMDDPDAGTQVLAERVGMSNTACWRKIEKLQELQESIVNLALERLY